MAKNNTTYICVSIPPETCVCRMTLNHISWCFALQYFWYFGGFCTLAWADWLDLFKIYLRTFWVHVGPIFLINKFQISNRNACKYYVLRERRYYFGIYCIVCFFSPSGKLSSRLEKRKNESQSLQIRMMTPLLDTLPRMTTLWVSVYTHTHKHTGTHRAFLELCCMSSHLIKSGIWNLNCKKALWCLI